jgi:hypothetical protein
MNIFKWFKNLFSKVESVSTENKPKVKCDRCKGTGYYMADNSEFRQRMYWCNCKMSYGKPPDNCHAIDWRWENCSHKMIIEHKDFDVFKPPHPDTIFEPYLKIYVYKQSQNIILGRSKWVKRLSYDGLSVIWEDLGGFYDEVEYSDLVSEIRDKKLKELGIN